MDPRFASLRVALFDLDGTLIRTFIDFPALHARMQAIAEAYGVGDETRDIADSLEIVARMTAALSGDIADRARREAFAAVEEIEEAGCASPVAIPGAQEVIAACRERQMKIGIVTRNSRRIALGLLDRMSLSYDVLIAREDVARFKPHPAPVLDACARLGAEPAAALMVGDLWADIAAAKAARVALSVGIQWPYDPPERFAACPPDLEVDSLSALLPFLGFPRLAT